MASKKPKLAHPDALTRWPLKRVKFVDPTGLIRMDDDLRVVPPGDGWEALVAAIDAGLYDPYLNAGSPWCTDRRYRDRGPTLLYVFARDGAMDVVRALLARGADVRMLGGIPYPKDPLGATPFPAVVGAVYGGHVAVLRLLLDVGGSPDDGTPLSGAVQYDHRDCFDLLLERGADVAAREPWGNGTLLEKAINLGRDYMAAEIRKRLAVRRAGIAPKLLRQSKKRSKTPSGPFSAFARARWSVHLSWVVLAVRGPIAGIAKAIGGGTILEDAATKRVVGRDVTFLLQMKKSKWTWYLWRPELHDPVVLPEVIEEQRAMALELSKKTGHPVLVFRDANVDRIERGKVTPVFEGRLPPFTLAEYGERPKVSSKEALESVDALCAKEGLELPHLIMEDDGLEWIIEVVGTPVENIARVDAIVNDEAQ